MKQRNVKINEESVNLLFGTTKCSLSYIAEWAVKKSNNESYKEKIPDDIVVEDKHEWTRRLGRGNLTYATDQVHNMVTAT